MRTFGDIGWGLRRNVTRTGRHAAAHRRAAGGMGKLVAGLALLAAALLGPLRDVRGEPELVGAFAFGSRVLDCATYNQPATTYTIVYQGTPSQLQYDSGRGWGYEVVAPGDTSRSGYGIFGPFDDTANSRDVFPDTCPEEIYDSFIGAKDFTTPCTAGEAAPCLPLEGIVFRVDVPNGLYRFVAAVGSADNTHTHRIVAEDGGSGPPASLGTRHVVLVHNFDQGGTPSRAGVFARVGFDGRMPPPAAVNGFVNMDASGLETAGDPDSPALEVTAGYLRIHQLKGTSDGSDPNGGNMVILELWKVEDSFHAVEEGSTWRFLQGVAEASLPDTGAWRLLGFDDASWLTGAAPIGYNDSGIVTDLSLLDPPMRYNYSSVFFRQTFDLASPAAVNQLTVRTDYDDGFVLWINGTEVLRLNVPGLEGDPVAYNGFAVSGHDSGLPEEYSLPDPDGYLVAGTNVVAAQIFNNSISSSDLRFDLGLFDPVAPDIRPPALELVVPAAGTTIRRLTQIQATFTEAVTGVDAADLLIGGSAAKSVTGAAAGPYVFSFDEPATGPVQVAWSEGHGIADLADPPNPFGGGGWTYTIDPDAPLGNVVINEILAVNGQGIVDEDGDESDWIEIHNAGTTTVNLSGWSLTDDPDSPDLWVFPAVEILPGAYRVVFASAKDRRPVSGNLHTNFELSPSGEYLGLYNAESPREVVSRIAPRFPRQRTDLSYGLDATGNPAYLDPPTPGEANGSAVKFDGFVLAPACSPGRGFQDAPVLVTIHTGTPGASIRYTLNGSEPTETSGTLYTAPVSVAPGGGKGVVALRAVAYKEGLFPSEVTTHSYIFIASVLGQTTAPTGFPTTWNGEPADYEVDPDVVNDSGHAVLVRNGLTAIPTLSIATHVDNLFSASTGIYANPANEGPLWERPVSAELVYPDGREGFQVDCGLRVQGGTSTSGWKSKKVSLRLLFKAEYGTPRLRFPLFSDSRVKEFDTVVLDAHLNQTWTHPTVSQQVKGDYCRELFVSDLQNAAGGYAPHDFFAHLYLNGLYWGVYDIHERADNAFAADYLGGDKTEYDVLKHTWETVMEGTNAGWVAMVDAVRKDLTINANYVDVWRYLDVPNFIDYMVVNYFTGNDDWDHHNWYATCHRDEGLYRIHSWDAEHVLKDTGINRLTVNNIINGKQQPTGIFTLLRASPEFRLLVADRVHRLFFNGGPMHVDTASPGWDRLHPERNVPASMYARRLEEADGFLTRLETGDPEVGSAIACESARWGDARRAVPYTRNVEWLTEVTWILNQYFPVRTGIVLGHLRAAGLYPTVGAPVFSRHGGRIDPGFALGISLPAGTTGTIYYTVNGVDPRVFGSGAVSSSAAAYSGPVVLNDHTIVKARILSGGNWSALDEAEFSLSDPQGMVVVSEIMYNPPGAANTEFIELANIGDTTVGLSDVYFSSGIYCYFPWGTVLPPGVRLVLVSDLAAFEAAYPGVEVAGTYSGQLANGGERVELSDSQGRTIASVDYDDEKLWPIGPDGFGYSLVPVDLRGDPKDPENWRASALPGGSPGAADPAPSAGGVIVNEVLARASPPLEGAIELRNTTGSPRSIGGWYLSDSRVDAAMLLKYRIPDGTVIPAGGYIVFYEYQFGPGIGSPSGFALEPVGGKVYLSSADGGGNLTGHIVEAEYGPEDADVSFGRIATSVGSDFTTLAARSFGVDAPGTVEEFRTGTGADNGDPRFGPVAINEVMFHPGPGKEEFIELFNPTGSSVPLYDAAVARGWRISGIRNALDTDSFEFGPGDSIPAGGFLLVVGISPSMFRSLHAIAASVPIVGPFGGGIDNAGERIALLRPGDPAGGDAPLPFVLIDAVEYDDESPWPDAADGGGASLERIFADSYGNDPVNWAASTRAGGTPGIENSVSTPGENRPPVARFDASPLSGTAPLDVLLDASQSYDLDGEIVGYSWVFGDGATGSGRIVTHIYGSPGSYIAILSVADDDGAVDEIQVTISVSDTPIGGQVPGDSNGDGRIDISDPIGLLLVLFAGLRDLPCGSDPSTAGNGALLDVNGDRTVDLTDALHLLVFLFQDGPPPALGTHCVPIVGCSDACDY